MSAYDDFCGCGCSDCTECFGADAVTGPASCEFCGSKKHGLAFCLAPGAMAYRAEKGRPTTLAKARHDAD
jgi:hypothetical protein